MTDAQPRPDEGRAARPTDQAEADVNDAHLAPAASENDQAPAVGDADPEPSTDELQEPSTEKEPGEEPKAAPAGEQQPSHEAVGIGVIGRPQTDLPEDPGR